MTYHNGRVFDGHDARHDVDDPLWIDDHVVTQEFIVKELDGSEVVQKEQRSFDLCGEVTRKLDMLHVHISTFMLVKLLRNRVDPRRAARRCRTGWRGPARW